MNSKNSFKPNITDKKAIFGEKKIKITNFKINFS